MHMTAIDIGVLDAFSRPIKERLLEFILTHIFAQRQQLPWLVPVWESCY